MSLTTEIRSYCPEHPRGFERAFLDADDIHLLYPDTGVVFIDYKGYLTYKDAEGVYKIHRLVLCISDPKVNVDHINRNKLDNRKCNLRLCDQTQNNANRTKNKNSSTKYKGVHLDSDTQMFKAQIQYKGRKVSLGTFKSPIHAACAYDIKAIELFKSFANLNFPEMDYTNWSPDEFRSDKRKGNRFHGVSWHKQSKRWRARANVDGKRVHLGSFESDVVASKAYNQYVSANKLNSPLNKH